jgi:hypothetical protein
MVYANVALGLMGGTNTDDDDAGAPPHDDGPDAEC